ncbi:lasso peptide biosynthesis B2 protein [Streptomyces sp. CS131]|uniref:lasso peptide biosynthesis B2 protein n=1 Tax=Streptomyces sp. CS131 TaxID=2162711 RepID=UPI000D5120FF|nr:lasso peptide biosynthesis B2 protein [Streptomyces sp. CS131]PVC85053.1 lasso peptide biosynthesis B2 protein [Streptomyces sp. CS131]
MSVTVALNRDHRPRSWKLRLQTRLAICLARILALFKPYVVRRVLVRLSKGAKAADAAEITTARDSVLASSLGLHGLRACLPRSLATALLCRFRGAWPTWCVGVRTAPPFAAHAWVEAGREMIGETGGYDSYSRLFTVPPTTPLPLAENEPATEDEPAPDQ